MMDALVASEGEPDLLQLSGGEPTIHPQIIEIIDAAKRRPIRHIMLNTNGIRIAQEPEFVEAAGRLQAGLRGLSAVRLAQGLGAQEPARRRPHPDSPAGAGSP